MTDNPSPLPQAMGSPASSEGVPSPEGRAAPTTAPAILDELRARFPSTTLALQPNTGSIPTVWVPIDQFQAILGYLKTGVPQPYRMLYDLTAIDERARTHQWGGPPDQPAPTFTAVYTLLSHERNEAIRVKVPLQGEFPSIPTITGLWPSANWYERETWDMFGIRFEGHPNLRRILMPPTWQGHPLRKESPARGTEISAYILEQYNQMITENSLQFNPADWGFQQDADQPAPRYLFLNLGPQHPSTHGPFRIVLALDGEEIVDCMPEIGFHHRGQEKMGERQSWHTYLPYTDRVDYLSGVMNEFPYVLTVEQLADIPIPDRAKVIRIMMAELFRIISHLVFIGTYAQDIGAMSPVFYAFTDRERAFAIVEAVTGGRMHPGWFRIGGVAQDLPAGWEDLIRDFLAYLPPRLDEIERVLLKSPIFQERTIGVGEISTEEALEWGVTGPFLRSTGYAWDWRKARPYSGYDQFEFDIPFGQRGDCYDRAQIHMEEMRQSLRIIQQCLDNMPPGSYKSDHPLATPPLKQYTMHDIETLINHFLNVSWGPIIPPGEAMINIESTKGSYGYYLISDGSVGPYRNRIRTASFPHLQTLPVLSRGLMIPDLVSILGSIDFVLADVDR